MPKTQPSPAKMRTKPPHEPTDAQRQLVQIHTTVGTDQTTMARILGISPKTMRKHYRDELDISKAQANATIGGALFNKAKGGDTTAMIFWMKTQARWRETSALELSGDDSKDPIRVEGAASKLMAHLSEIEKRSGTTSGDPSE